MTTPNWKSEVARQVHEALAPLGVVPLDAELPQETSIGRVRRRRTAGTDDVRILSLVDVDGVLLWEDGPVATPAVGPRRRGAGIPSADGEVVTQVKYEKPLGLNSVVDRLHALDTSLTPAAAAGTPAGAQLLEYDRTTWQAAPVAAPRAKGRVLLFIHGTFSRTEKLVDELRADAKFLSSLAGAYDQVLGFDHFTVSRSPVINAAELARCFARSEADIDIVCHSRGGLVARWFVEMLDPFRHRNVRIVFVGCPLRGTSLADPQSLRHGINLMTNVGKVLGQGAALVPFLQAASGLMQIFSSIGAVVADSPLVDIGVGLLPGIAAMSRVERNAELNALNHGAPAGRDGYYAVSSTFRTEDAGWKFWKLFNAMKAADAAADYLVFRQDNDLVVDTSSMTHFAFGPSPNMGDSKRFCVFGEADAVHHTSYFRAPRTLAFMSRAFGLTGGVSRRHAGAVSAVAPARVAPPPPPPAPIAAVRRAPRGRRAGPRNTA